MDSRRARGYNARIRHVGSVVILTRWRLTMPVPRKYQSDVQAILARRRHNGADCWATADGRVGKGTPFSTFDCALMLTELGVSRSDPVLRKTANVLLGAWQEDGRFRVAPKGTIYPCHTATAARMLCRLGFAKDRRLKKTFEHLFDIQHTDSGWRCNTVKLGRSAKNDASNPGPTLEALDGFRFTPFLNTDKRLDRGVRFLLDHWNSRKPLGPCDFGIGTLFMKVEYPFFRYNLFYYVYIMSFYNAAKKDKRFRAAFAALESKLVDGKVVVENPKRELAKYAFCEKGRPSDLATKRYREILKNLSR